MEPSCTSKLYFRIADKINTYIWKKTYIEVHIKNTFNRVIWLTCKQKKLLFPAASNWQLWKLKIFPYRLLFLLISFGHISIPICYDILAVVLVSAEIFYSLSEYICLMPSWEMWQINYVFMTNKELRTGGHCFRLVLRRGTEQGFAWDVVALWSTLEQARFLGPQRGQHWSVWSNTRFCCGRCLVNIWRSRRAVVLGQSSWFIVR